MIQKSTILPIVSAVLLVLGNIFHIQFPDNLGGEVSDVIVSLLLLWHTVQAGILKNHKQEPPQQGTQQSQQGQ